VPPPQYEVPTYRRCTDEQPRGKEEQMMITDKTLGLTSRHWRLIEFSLLIACLLISASLILRESGVVPGAPMDQHFVETVSLKLQRNNGHWIFQYPNLQYAGGITSSLIAGMYKLIIPTTHDNLNWHFRIFSMAGLLLSSFYLFQTTIPNNPGLRTAAFLIIATSGYQLLQPSSDVLAGTLLCLFLISALRAWPKVIAAFFLALFGLGKVELSLAALVLSLFWSYWEYKQGKRNAWQGILYTVLWMSLLIFPAMILEGANPFRESRSTLAFFSAYSGFMRFHQFNGIAGMNESEITQAIKDNIFPRANSFTDVIMKYPQIYFDYIGVSAARSIPNILKVFKFMLIPFAIILLQVNEKIKENKFLIFTAILAACFVITPAWLVIFARMRYVAKILPLMTAATIAGSIELAKGSRTIKNIIWLSASLTIIWQALGLTFYQD
jgi:hypothetical protein